MPPKVIAIDFDGVIHSYKSGWQGASVANDPPVDGMAEAIAELRREYQVVVVSSRCLHEGGTQAIKDYLEKHNIAVDGITGEKIPALAYIDDRAIPFYGKASELPGQVKRFKPWHTRW